MLLTGLGKNKVTVNEVNPEDLVGKILDFILWVIAIAGAATFIWGAYEFYQTFHDNNGDKREKAILKMIGGAFLIGIRIVLQSWGVIS